MYSSYYSNDEDDDSDNETMTDDIRMTLRRIDARERVQKQSIRRLRDESRRKDSQLSLKNARIAELEDLVEDLKERNNELNAQAAGERENLDLYKREVLCLRFQLASQQYGVTSLVDEDFPDGTDLVLPGALLKACEKGLLTVVNSLLDVGVSSDRADYVSSILGHAALRACAKGHHHVATALIDKGANVNVVDAPSTGGRSLLHHAAVSEKTELLDKLLSQSNIHKNVEDARGRTPLHVAAKLKKAKSVRVLLSKGADVEAKTPEGHTAYDLATSSAGGFSSNFLSAEQVKTHFHDRKLRFWNYSSQALYYYKRSFFFKAFTCFREAVKVNDEANGRLAHGMDLARLYYNTGKSAMNASHYVDALRMAEKALEVDDEYDNAIRLRAECNMKLFEFCKAHDDSKELDRLTRDNTSKRLDGYTRRQLQELSAMKHHDFLGVDANASRSEVKRAFRDLSRKWHPDKQKSSDDAYRAKILFQRLNEANRVLSSSDEDRFSFAVDTTADKPWLTEQPLHVQKEEYLSKEMEGLKEFHESLKNSVVVAAEKNDPAQQDTIATEPFPVASSAPKHVDTSSNTASGEGSSVTEETSASVFPSSSPSLLSPTVSIPPAVFGSAPKQVKLGSPLFGGTMSFGGPSSPDRDVNSSDAEFAPATPPAFNNQPSVTWAVKEDEVAGNEPSPRVPERASSEGDAMAKDVDTASSTCSESDDGDSAAHPAEQKPESEESTSSSSSSSSEGSGGEEEALEEEGREWGYDFVYQVDAEMLLDDFFETGEWEGVISAIDESLDGVYKEEFALCCEAMRGNHMLNLELLLVLVESADIEYLSMFLKPVKYGDMRDYALAGIRSRIMLQTGGVQGVEGDGDSYYDQQSVSEEEDSEGDDDDDDLDGDISDLERRILMHVQRQNQFQQEREEAEERLKSLQEKFNKRDEMDRIFFAAGMSNNQDEEDE